MYLNRVGIHFLVFIASSLLTQAAPLDKKGAICQESNGSNEPTASDQCHQINTKRATSIHSNHKPDGLNDMRVTEKRDSQASDVSDTTLEGRASGATRAQLEKLNQEIKHFVQLPKTSAVEDFEEEVEDTRDFVTEIEPSQPDAEEMLEGARKAWRYEYQRAKEERVPTAKIEKAHEEIAHLLGQKQKKIFAFKKAQNSKRPEEA